MSWGVLLASVGALAASSAPTLGQLIAACGLLGFGAAAGVVTGRAHIADTSVGTQATRRFTVLQLSISIAPIVGPIAGAALLVVGDWRMVFLSLAAFAVVGTVAVMLFVPESLAEEHRRARSLVDVARTMGGILATRRYLTYALCFWFAFGMMFAYISTSSSIFQTGFGLSSGLYALDFAGNGAGLVIMSIVAATLAHRVPPARLVVIGLAVQVVAILSLGVAQLTARADLLVVIVGLFVITSSMGLVIGPSTSLAVEPVRDRAGTALALLGSLQFVAAGIASFLTAIIPAESVATFLIVGATCSVTALAAGIVGARITPSHNHTKGLRDHGRS